MGYIEEKIIHSKLKMYEELREIDKKHIERLTSQIKNQSFVNGAIIFILSLLVILGLFL